MQFWNRIKLSCQLHRINGTIDPILRMDDNAFRAPEKHQPKLGTMGRKPFRLLLIWLITPGSYLQRTSHWWRISMLLIKAPEKMVQPKLVGRTPLGDLTNSNQPQDTWSEKIYTEHFSSVNKMHSHSFDSVEGFLQNNDECIKANRDKLQLWAWITFWKLLTKLKVLIAGNTL